jgi:Uncharacterised protein family UPF0102
MSVTTKNAGSAAEALALRFLQRQGMKAVVLNYRVARGPGRPGGEIDLILRDRDGTLVFVEVRQRCGGQRECGQAPARRPHGLALPDPDLAAAAVPIRRGGDRRRPHRMAEGGFRRGMTRAPR